MLCAGVASGYDESMMNTLRTSWQTQLAQEGFLLLPGVFAITHVEAITQQLAEAFARDANGSTLRTQQGGIYGARNLMHMWPDVTRVWQEPPLPEMLREILGLRFGLVRVLYFDKPPEQSWALPWHKDMTIAVKSNRLPSEHFTKPTSKVGVPHVEAPQWLLENMLTLRLHLDDMTEENGPLKVLPGSHHSGKTAAASQAPPISILGRRGDVLLMRPLISHCSNKSHEDTKRHRRILHYEFASMEELPDGYAWHDFLRFEGSVR
jgi:hypothetical protein